MQGEQICGSVAACVALVKRSLVWYQLLTSATHAAANETDD